LYSRPSNCSNNFWKGHKHSSFRQRYWLSNHVLLGIYLIFCGQSFSGSGKHCYIFVVYSTDFACHLYLQTCWRASFVPKDLDTNCLPEVKKRKGKQLSCTGLSLSMLSPCTDLPILNPISYSHSEIGNCHPPQVVIGKNNSGSSHDCAARCFDSGNGDPSSETAGFQCLPLIRCISAFEVDTISVVPTNCFY
jgi:hypothetical protein